MPNKEEEVKEEEGLDKLDGLSEEDVAEIEKQMAEEEAKLAAQETEVQPEPTPEPEPQYLPRRQGRPAGSRNKTSPATVQGKSKLADAISEAAVKIEDYITGASGGEGIPELRVIVKKKSPTSGRYVHLAQSDQYFNPGQEELEDVIQRIGSRWGSGSYISTIKAHKRYNFPTQTISFEFDDPEADQRIADAKAKLKLDEFNSVHLGVEQANQPNQTPISPMQTQIDGFSGQLLDKMDAKDRQNFLMMMQMLKDKEAIANSASKQAQELQNKMLDIALSGTKLQQNPMQTVIPQGNAINDAMTILAAITPLIKSNNNQAAAAPPVNAFEQMTQMMGFMAQFMKFTEELKQGKIPDNPDREDAEPKTMKDKVIDGFGNAINKLMDVAATKLGEKVPDIAVGLAGMGMGGGAPQRQAPPALPPPTPPPPKEVSEEEKQRIILARIVRDGFMIIKNGGTNDDFWKHITTSIDNPQVIVNVFNHPEETLFNAIKTNFLKSMPDEKISELVRWIKSKTEEIVQTAQMQEASGEDETGQ